MKSLTISDFKISIKVKNMKWRRSQLRLYVMGSLPICQILFVKLSYNVYEVYQSFIVVCAL